jgi:hypothetical protein
MTAPRLHHHSTRCPYCLNDAPLEDDGYVLMGLGWPPAGAELIACKCSHCAAVIEGWILKLELLQLRVQQ